MGDWFSENDPDGSLGSGSTGQGSGDWFAENDPRLEPVALERPRPKAESSVLDTLGDAGRGVMEGSTFGYANELAEKVGGLVGGSGDVVPRTSTRGIQAPVMSESQARNLRAEAMARQLEADSRARLALAENRSPVSTFAGDLAGGWATGGGLAKGAGKVALKYAPRIAQAVEAGGKARLAANVGEGVATGALDAAGRSGPGSRGGDAGQGGLVGGGVSAVLGGAGRLMRKAPGALDTLIAQADDKAVVGMAPEVAATARELADLDKGKAAREMVRRGQSPDVLEAHTRDVASDIDEMEDVYDKLTAVEDVGAKLPIVRNTMWREGLDPEVVNDRAMGTWRSVRQQFDLLQEDIGNGEHAALLKRLRREVIDPTNKAMQDLEGPQKRQNFDSVSQKFMALDHAKRQLQKAVVGLAPGDSAVHNSEVRQRIMGDLEPELRFNLEDANTWGKGASGMQKARNEGWTRYLTVENSRKVDPERAFLTDATGEASTRDPYRLKRKADLGGVETTLRDAPSLQGEQKADVLRRWADRKAGLLEALTGHEGAPVEEVQGAKLARHLAGNVEKRIAQRIEEGRAKEAFDRVAAVEPPRPGMVTRLGSKIPGVGPLVQELAPRSKADVAKELIQLESTPDNTAALARLKEIRLQEAAKRKAVENARKLARGSQVLGGLVEASRPAVAKRAGGGMASEEPRFPARTGAGPQQFARTEPTPSQIDQWVEETKAKDPVQGAALAYEQSIGNPAYRERAKTASR